MNAANIISYDNAGVDVTSWYAASDFCLHSKPTEPWAAVCFASIVDVAINHTLTLYPRAKRKLLASEESGDIPMMLAAFKKAGICRPYSAVIAEDIAISNEDLNDIFCRFQNEVRRQPDLYRQWSNYHLSIEERNKALRCVAINILPCVHDWCAENQTIHNLAKDVGLKNSTLAYIFDVFVRGLTYYDILKAANAPYFEHPLRSALLVGGLHESFSSDKELSWGRLISNLLEEGILSRNPQEIADLVREIQIEVHGRRVSWYQGKCRQSGKWVERVEIMRDIAAELGLPPKVRGKAVDILGLLLSGVSAYVDDRVGTTPLITVAIMSGHILSDPKNRRLHGAVGRAPFLRGVLRWSDCGI